VQDHEEIQFFTATILEWKHLLKPDKYKDIIVESLKFLSLENRAIIFALPPKLRGVQPFSFALEN